MHNRKSDRPIDRNKMIFKQQPGSDLLWKCGQKDHWSSKVIGTGQCGTVDVMEKIRTSPEFTRRGIKATCAGTDLVSPKRHELQGSLIY